MNFIKNNKAFSIVELLVVIVVIAILATIGFVAYNWVVDDARDTQIKSYVADTGKALKAAYYKKDLVPTEGYYNNTNGVDKTLEGVMDTVNGRKSLKTKNASLAITISRYYNCDGAGNENKFVIYASLNSPTQDDKNNLNTIKSNCGQTDREVPKSGNPTYNYAQLFEY